MAICIAIRSSSQNRFQILLDIDGDVIRNIDFYGGCNGNLKAIAKLVDGWTVDKIGQMLFGNTCGRRPTSCADQLAKAVSDPVQNAGQKQPMNKSSKRTKAR